MGTRMVALAFHHGVTPGREQCHILGIDMGVLPSPSRVPTLGGTQKSIVPLMRHVPWMVSPREPLQTCLGGMVQSHRGKDGQWRRQGPRGALPDPLLPAASSSTGGTGGCWGAAVGPAFPDGCRVSAESCSIWVYRQEYQF